MPTNPTPEPRRDEAVKLSAVEVLAGLREEMASLKARMDAQALNGPRTLPPVQDDDVERAVQAVKDWSYGLDHRPFDGGIHALKGDTTDADAREIVVAVVSALSTRSTSRPACFEQAARIAMEHYVTPGWPEMYQEAGRGIAKAILEAAPTGTVGGEGVERLRQLVQVRDQTENGWVGNYDLREAIEAALNPQPQEGE